MAPARILAHIGTHQWLDLLRPPRSSDRHRKLAAPLQYDQAACLARLPATCTRGVPARLRRVAGCATPTGSAGHAGATANLKLTFHLDHSAGADHKCAPSSDQLTRTLPPGTGRLSGEGPCVSRPLFFCTGRNLVQHAALDSCICMMVQLQTTANKRSHEA